VLPWQRLAAGFEIDGCRVPLVSQQGIFKPAVLADVPLSIRTAAGGPYEDAFGPGDFLRCRYRVSDPNHTDTARQRRTMADRPFALLVLHGRRPQLDSLPHQEERDEKGKQRPHSDRIAQIDEECLLNH
jgi:putative restriction endonuclease